MADTPPVADAPRKAAKGLSGVFKNKPAWMWVAGITVLIGVAYLTFARRNVEDPGQSQDTTTADDALASADANLQDGYDYGVPQYTTTGSEGAYGGYDQPPDYAPVTSDNAGNPEAPLSPVTVNVSYPAPTGGGKPAATGVAAHAPVAGGAKKWEGHNLAWWQNPAHASRMVKVGKQKHKVRRWRWPGEPRNRFVHTRAFRGH